MKNSIIDKREDGFSISYASLKDFKKLQELVKGLSKESRCLFTPWLFLENPRNKVKMGQLIAKISLLPIFKTIIKKIFPFGLLVILKVTSDKNQIVGFVYEDNFIKIHSGYSASHATVIADKFQGQGLGKFLQKCMHDIERKENVRHLRTGVFQENKASLSMLIKDGWEVTKVEKNILITCGKRHDVVRLTKDFNKTNRFLITEVNTSYNKGDAAIVLGILQILRELFPKSEICVLTPTPEHDLKYYSKYAAKTSLQLYDYMGRTTSLRIYRLMFLIKMIYLSITSMMRVSPFRKKNKLIFNLYKKADLVISCSGGRLGGKKQSPILDQLVPLYYANLIGKKIFICAQSIEPFRSTLIKNLSKFILNRVDVITVREQTSFDILNQIKIKTPFYLTADLAFLPDPCSIDVGRNLLKKAGIPESEKNLVGVTVTRWRVKDSNASLKEENYVNAMVSTIEKIIEEQNAHVIFFPQVIFGPYEDDREFSKIILTKISKKFTSKIFILTDDYSPNELKSMMGMMNFFIGKRLHSCIFALSMKIPSIVIDYEQKSKGIMKMLNLEDYTIDVHSISNDKLYSKVQNLIVNQKKIKKTLEEQIPIIQNYAKSNGSFVKDLLGN